MTIPIVTLYKVYFWNGQQKEISEWKVYRIIFTEMNNLTDALCNPKEKLQTFLEELREEIEYRGFKDRKKIIEDKVKITKLLPIDILAKNT